MQADARTPSTPGRKPLPANEKKVQRSIVLLPHTLAVLEQMRATPTEGLGAVIDRLVAGKEQE